MPKRERRCAPEQDAVHVSAQAACGEAVAQLVQQHAACVAAAGAASGEAEGASALLPEAGARGARTPARY